MELTCNTNDVNWRFDTLSVRGFSYAGSCADHVSIVTRSKNRGIFFQASPLVSSARLTEKARPSADPNAREKKKKTSGTQGKMFRALALGFSSKYLNY